LFKRFKNHFAVVSLMLVVLLLSGCFGGPKTFTVTVQLDTELAGVEIREGSKTGSILGETTEKGVAELKNVKEGTVLVPVKDGYTFNPETKKVTKAGTVAFKAIKDEPSPEPGEKDITSVTNPDAIEVYKDKAPFDQLNLPEKVSVTLADDTKVEVKVEWKAGDYDNTKEGTYTLVGELKPEGDIKNPSSLQAEMKVTVVDATKKAEEQVKAVEGLALPTHYNQVAAIETAIKDAYAVVAQVDDVAVRAALNVRIDKKNDAFKAVLQGHVARVGEVKSNAPELFEALKAFWDVDAKYTATYSALASDANAKISTVHEIQKNVVEKAPTYKDDTEAAKAIVLAAQGERLIHFKNTVLGYGTYFERLNIEHDDENDTIWTAYKDSIDDLNAETATIKDIQVKIDAVNLAQTKSAVGVGDTLKLVRKDLNRANELIVYVAEGAERKSLVNTLADLGLILDVVEAKTEADLAKALVDLKSKFVYTQNMKQYLTIIAAEKANLPAATTENIKKYIQENCIDVVNLAQVNSILAQIAAITTDTPLHRVEDLLDLLDAATPIAGPIDFDLGSKELSFDRTRMSFYRAELKGKGSIGDVKNAIKAGNAKFDAQFDKFTVKIDSATITDGIKFTIKALNKAGKDFDGALTGYKATISVSGQTASVDNLTFVGNTATVTVLGGKVLAVVDSTVADVTISKGTAGQQGYEEYKITSAPFAIGATATTGTVVIDGNKKEFTAGETIKATVTLYYDTNKVLTTESGTYAAVVTIGTEPENRFNRTVKFTKGVAEIEVPANKVDEAQVEVIIAGMPKLKTTDAIKIKHAVAAKVAVTHKSTIGGKLTGVEVTVQDAKGNTVTSLNGAYDGTVSYALKVELKAQADPPPPNVPDTEGKVSLVFTNGVANIVFGDFLNELQAGKTYVITINAAGFTTQFEYEVPK